MSQSSPHLLPSGSLPLLQRTKADCKEVIGCDLPSLLDLFHSRTSKRACKILAGLSHPGHHLFQRLPSGRRFRAIKTKTLRHLNSFFPHDSGAHKQAPGITLTLGLSIPIHNYLLLFNILYLSFILVFAILLLCYVFYVLCTNHQDHFLYM